MSAVLIAQQRHQWRCNGRLIQFPFNALYRRQYAVRPQPFIIKY